MTMLVDTFKKLKSRVLDACRVHYGDRLVSFVVFGSVARGAMRHDSDLDILIIADGLPNGRLKRMAEFESIEQVLEPFLSSLRKEGIHTDIMPVIKSREEATRGTLLFLDMTEDAEILSDRDGFFGAVLDRLRSRLKELGSKRIWKGNAWYWVLKPDYKPGETFEI